MPRKHEAEVGEVTRLRGVCKAVTGSQEGGMGPSLPERLWSKHDPAETVIWGFWPPELWHNKSLLISGKWPWDIGFGPSAIEPSNTTNPPEHQAKTAWTQLYSYGPMWPFSCLFLHHLDRLWQVLHLQIYTQTYSWGRFFFNMNNFWQIACSQFQKYHPSLLSQQAISHIT